MTQPASWQTWHAQRLGSADPAERDAAQKAEAHANTPTTAHLDALGRVFLTLAHNRYVRNGATCRRALRHPRRARHRGQPAGGARRRQESGRCARQRDRGRARAHRHALRLRHARQPHPPSQHGGGRALDAERRGGQADPGLGQPRLHAPHDLRRTAAAHRVLRDRERRRAAGRADGLRRRPGRPRTTTDAGVPGLRRRRHAHYVAYDFKGNLLRSTRDCCPTTSTRSTGDTILRRTTAASPAARPTTPSTARPLVTAPDGSVYRPTFNEANLLDKVDVSLAASSTARDSPRRRSSTNIDYNAKGQRS